MPTALLLENLHPHARTILETAGFDVVTRTGALDESELVEALAGVQVLGIRSKTNVPADVLAAAPDLEAVGAFCIGTNQIDLHAAASQGIAVFNAPFSNTRSVVEIAIADIISLTRRLTVFDKEMHAGVWNKSATGAHEVRGRTLGIIGYGNIGTQLSVLAENLGMSVVFYDSAEKLALGNARRMNTLDELLETADVVTLHVDGRAGNAGMFGAKQIARMRPGSIFLNLSRGFVVDYAALRDAILSGHVAGAAVDVFPVEPKRKGDAFESELRGLPNVILTPHTGGSTEEAQEAIGQFVANKVRDYLTTGSTNLSVNLPNLALDQRPDAHRVAYLHRNVPGVLATINATLAEHGVNIEGQLLATRGELGYVVTDVSSPVPTDVVDVLAGRPESLRLRLLD
ncbi:phosphoglycerate dehydrogenase [Cellulomonas xiejunii]|uniref:D-3-phosphoglycerate dehydrogenase n=1 Tax=Cellulomonas xiejunii TaxID=2968083 RepID=A0ABY5KUB8_9CELL|nr:phosphoglycerate dehydrogenase [Cellulomonas xiejunii]MCC2315998.1 phosphoglycerate dehydrogenase [Cellulomonas xiejunii]MCC2322031.1 phosphoglycerate dehydrogenase [Cellulomonas xiejunii]UUI73323.1 phosphoglycerate dehydrogenase [Cellulomonas xiejunii]